MKECDPQVDIVGGGLAGSEAAWQLAERGVAVRLYEMRPALTTPAHHTGWCAELVCSNSFKSDEDSTAAGTLKRELTLLGSRLLAQAYHHRVPAGGALAVDREAFSEAVHRDLHEHPLIDVRHEEYIELDPKSEQPTIVAAGPLASPALTEALQDITGVGTLAFYDAAAPLVTYESLDMGRVFAASRYGKGEGADYLNCALNEEEYRVFYEALVGAERARPKDFERKDLFSACQPVEEVARHGYDALRFGAMKPVGIEDPRTGRYPYALLQLRPENREGQLYNIVGFQTNLTFSEQRRVFSLIPGLEQVEFARYGVMHKNTFVDAPRVMRTDFSLDRARNIYLAGQICGTEGYLEAVGSGLLCALNVAARLAGSKAALTLPTTTVLGALLRYGTDPSVQDYQPMHVNFGLLPPLNPTIRRKAERRAALSLRAQEDMRAWVKRHV